MKPDLKIIQPKPVDPGDAQFFEQAYQEYFSSVFNYIRYRVANSTFADDLTSISFHKALEKLPGFDPARASFSTWIFAIARNTVNDHLRKNRRRKLLSVDWLMNKADGRMGAEESLIGKEERQRLWWLGWCSSPRG